MQNIESEPITDTIVKFIGFQVSFTSTVLEKDFNFQEFHSSLRITAFKATIYHRRKENLMDVHDFIEFYRT